MECIQYLTLLQEQLKVKLRDKDIEDLAKQLGEREKQVSTLYHENKALRLKAGTLSFSKHIQYLVLSLSQDTQYLVLSLSQDIQYLVLSLSQDIQYLVLSLSQDIQYLVLSLSQTFECP
jgi:hypothetical protein